MIRTVLAWITILVGIYWAVRPQSLKRMMARKANWMAFCLAAGLLLLPLLQLGRSSGLLGLIVMLIIFGMMLSSVFAVSGKFFGGVPLRWFQAIGIINIIGGVLLLRGSWGL